MPADTRAIGPYLLVGDAGERAADARGAWRVLRQGPGGDREFALVRTGVAVAAEPEGEPRPFRPSLSHLNLVEPREVMSAGGERFVATEWFDGVGLDRVIEAGGPLPVSAAAWVVAEAARGVGFLHSRRVDGVGLLHRRLDPGRVLLGRDGGVKVGGLEHVLVADQDDRPGLFRAPEQRAKEPLDPRSDVWALGALLLFAATGHAPPEDAGALAATLDGAAGARAGLPAALQLVLRRALATARDARYGSAEALRADLLAFVDGRDVPFDRAALAALLRGRRVLPEGRVPVEVDPIDRADDGDGDAVIVTARFSRPKPARTNGHASAPPPPGAAVSTETSPTGALPAMSPRPDVATTQTSTAAHSPAPPHARRRDATPEPRVPSRVPALLIVASVLALVAALATVAVTNRKESAPTSTAPPVAASGSRAAPAHLRLRPLFAAASVALCRTPPGAAPVPPSAGEAAQIEALYAAGDATDLMPLVVLQKPDDAARRLALIRAQAVRGGFVEPAAGRPREIAEVCERVAAMRALYRLAPDGAAGPVGAFLDAAPPGATVEDGGLRVRVLGAHVRSEGLDVDLRLINDSAAPGQVDLHVSRLASPPMEIVPKATPSTPVVPAGARRDVRLHFAGARADAALGGVLRLASGRNMAFEIAH